MFFYQFSFITMQAQVPYYPQNILPLSLNNKIFTKIFCHKTPFKNEILLKNLIKAKWWQNTLYDHVFLKKKHTFNTGFQPKSQQKMVWPCLTKVFFHKNLITKGVSFEKKHLTYSPETDIKVFLKTNYHKRCFLTISLL